MNETKAQYTPGPWRWQRAENGQGGEETTLVGSPDEWVKCEYFCVGWKEGSPKSRGPVGKPGHEHNRAPTVLAADGWHGSGDITIDTDSPDARLIAAAPAILATLKAVHSWAIINRKMPPVLCATVEQAIADATSP